MNKRGAGGSSGWTRGNGRGRQALANDKTVRISGPYTRVYQPEQLDTFSGWAVVVIGGNVVRGRLPILDPNFSYNLRCVLVDVPSRGPEYQIRSLEEPPFEPLPLTRERLKLMMKQTLGMQEHTADEIITGLAQDPRLVGMDFAGNNLDSQRLLTQLAPTPDWLERLAKNSLYFRYPFVKVLHRFWSTEELSNCSIQQLLQISSEFDRDPESFAYCWRNEFHLPELSLEKVKLAYRVLNRPEPVNLAVRITIYGNCRFQTLNRGRPCVTIDDFHEWGMRTALEPCVAAKIIRPHGASRVNPADPTGPLLFENFYWSWPEWLRFQRVMAGLARLISRPVSQGLFLKKPRTIGLPYSELNAQQQYLMDSSRQYGLLFWNAGAGTGKTTTALSSAALSSSRSVLPTAYFGRVAANLRRGWRSGITIHRLHHLLKGETEQGEKYKKYVRRVFVDEGSHVTFELLDMLFELPALEQLIFMGDMHQMRPPSGVPIYESLLRFYADTPLVQTLSVVMRVDREGLSAEAAQALIDNGLKLRDGRCDLVFSREMAPSNSFVLVPRINIPLDLYKSTEAHLPAVRQQRVELVKQTLRPVLEYLEANHTSYQMLALRHDMGNDMNMALSQIWKETPADGFIQERVYRPGSKITFSQNYYPQKELTLPSAKKDNARRQQILNSVAWRSRTTQVNNNEICTIVSIVDIDMATGEERPVKNTAELRVPENAQRILRLDNGQINLSDISLSRVFPGNVSTISSSQGGEWDCVFLMLDQRDCIDEGRGSLMKRDVLYTVATRARKQVIIACWAPHDDLSRSDIGIVANSQRQPADLVLHNWLPRFVDFPQLIEGGGDDAPGRGGNEREEQQPAPIVQDEIDADEDDDEDDYAF